MNPVQLARVLSCLTLTLQEGIQLEDPNFLKITKQYVSGMNRNKKHPEITEVDLLLIINNLKQLV